MSTRYSNRASNEPNPLISRRILLALAAVIASPWVVAAVVYLVLH